MAGEGKSDLIASGVDAGGVPRRLLVYSDGTLAVQGGGAMGADGAILDGASPTIKATVLDLTNSNPLAVRLVDSNGDGVALSGGGGGGTEYTEDAASIADPIGGQLMGRRRDSLSVETSADGDVTALNVTGKGELYVKQTDAVPVTDNGGSLTVDGTVNVGNFPATQPVSIAATVTTDVSDRDARLLGRAKILDSAGTVIDPALKGQLPAALVSGRLDVNIGASIAIPVTDNAGSLTVDGTVTVQDGGNVISVDDAAGSLTVDAPVGTPVAARLSDGTAFLTTTGGRLAVDASGVAVPVTDNAGSLTVDGTVTANAGTGPWPVTDNSGSLTVDAPVGTPVFVRLSDGSAALVGQKTMANSLPVVIASDQSALAVSQSGTWTVQQGTPPWRANPDIGQGKTLLFGSFAQGAAGTTTLVAADASNKIKLVSYVFVLDAAGTLKFSDSVGDLSGAFPVAANGGVASLAQPSSHLLETAAINRPLQIVTTGGKAFGHFSYFKEP